MEGGRWGMERDIIAVASAAVKHCSTTMQLDRQNFPFFLFSAWYSDLQGVFKLFDLVGPNGTVARLFTVVRSVRG